MNSKQVYKQIVRGFSQFDDKILRMLADPTGLQPYMKEIKSCFKLAMQNSKHTYLIRRNSKQTDIPLLFDVKGNLSVRKITSRELNAFTIPPLTNYENAVALALLKYFIYLTMPITKIGRSLLIVGSIDAAVGIYGLLFRHAKIINTNPLTIQAPNISVYLTSGLVSAFRKRFKDDYVYPLNAVILHEIGHWTAPTYFRIMFGFPFAAIVGSAAAWYLYEKSKRTTLHLLMFVGVMTTLLIQRSGVYVSERAADGFAIKAGFGKDLAKALKAIDPNYEQFASIMGKIIYFLLTGYPTTYERIKRGESADKQIRAMLKALIQGFKVQNSMLKISST